MHKFKKPLHLSGFFYYYLFAPKYFARYTLAKNGLVNNYFFAPFIYYECITHKNENKKIFDQSNLRLFISVFDTVQSSQPPN